MVTPLVVILVLSESTSGGAPGLVKTLAGNLDRQQVALTVRRAGRLPLDLLEPLTERGPVVVIEWESPRRASLRAALRPKEWTTRVVEFGAKDPLGERARTLGFATASMFPHWRPTQPGASASPPEVTAFTLDLVPPATTPAATTPAATTPAATTPAAATPAAATPEVPRAPPSAVVVAPPPADAPASAPPPGERRFRAGVVAVAGTPVVAGGGLQVGWCGSRLLCAGLEGAALTGPLASAGGTRVDVRVAAFLELRLPLGSDVRPLARLSGAVTSLTVRRGDEVRDRWLGLGTLEGGAAWTPKDGGLDVTLTAGATVMPPTTILVRGETVSEVPWLQGHLRLGAALHL